MERQYALKMIFSLKLMLCGINSQQIEQYICDQPGHIENPNDDSCNSFYVCSITSEGNLLQTEHSCPDGSIFLPEEICSEIHECTRSSNSSEEVSEIEGSDNIHYECQDENEVKVECIKSGLYADLQGSSCNKYYVCSLLPNGSYVRSEYECSEGTLFDPSSQKCHSYYQCPCIHNKYTNTVSKLTTDAEQQLMSQMITTPATNYCEQPEHEIVCNKTGRFPDRRDMSCNTYYVCDIDEYGNFTRRNYRCPKCLTFDPFLTKCTDNYLCPCSNTEAPEITTIIATRASSSNETTPASVSTTIKLRKDTYSENSTNSGGTSSNASTQTENECFVSFPSNSFSCSSKGRFADKRDLSCSSYFLCSVLRNGTFIKTHYECPFNSWFDPTRERCSTLYVCPCTDTSTISGASAMISVSTVSDSTTTPEVETSSFPITDSYSKINSSEETQVSYLTTNEPRNSTYSKITGNSVDSTSNTSTETVNECIASSSPNSFSCTSRGRFDMRDSSCSFYFLCSALRNGTLIKTSYKCPINSWFDPTKKRCSTLYVCSCTDTTTISGESTTISVSTIGDSTTTPEGTYLIINSTEDLISSTGETRVSFLTTNEPRNFTYSENTANSGYTTLNTYTETVMKCVAFSSSYSFNCTSRGRFANMRDLSCSSYFLCSFLRNGTLIKTSYKCPTNSWFDPSAERCSTLYVCPCSDTSSISGAITTISKSTIVETTTTPVGETSSSPITDRDIYSESVDTTSNTLTETVNECVASSSSYSFNCTSRGRFADMRDLSCSSYFLCSALRNGTLIKTSYKCPTNSWFDLAAERCSTLYVCPCTDTSTISGANTTISASTIGDSSTRPKEATSTFPITDRDTYSIMNSTQDMIASTGVTQISFSTTNEPRNYTYSTRTANSEDSTSSASTTTVNKCIASYSSNAFSCTSRGRFADMRDLSCSSYFLCSALRNGTLIKTSYKCPTNSWFDPTVERCSILYVCPCSDTSTISGASSTISVTTIGETTTTPEGATSSFPITDRDTSSIINSTQDMIASTGERQASLSTANEPGNYTYSTRTVNSEDSTSGPSRTTVNECIASSSSNAFSCTSRGRFADMRDLSCSSYFLCSALRNGTLIKTSYKCPTNSWFDPTAERCRILYVCPCSDTSTISGASTTISVTTIGDSTTTPVGETSSFPIRDRGTYSMINSTEYMIALTEKTRASVLTTNQPGNYTYSANSVDTTSNTSTETANECIDSTSSYSFNCTSRGRFADMRDLSCSSYFLCSALRNGTFIKTSYKCSINSLFDRSAQRCSTLYVCPCSDMSTLSEASTTISVSTIGETPAGETSSSLITDRDTYSIINTTEDMIASTEEIQAGFSTTNEPRNHTYSTRTANSEDSTTTVDECIASSSSNAFSCTSRGRFANKGDLSCSSYFLCSALRNGTLIKTSYKCPTNSWFDPTAKKCSTLYVCPCSDTSTISGASTTISVTTIGDSTTTPVVETSSFPITDTGTYSMINSTEYIIAMTEKTRASVLTTNHPRNYTYSANSVDTTSNTSTETANECIASSSYYSFNCTSRGRFADMRDLSCSSYFLCSALRNGTLLKTSYKCPTNSWFDPSAERCSTLYVCSCSDTSTVSEASTTISVSTIGETTTTPVGETSSSLITDRDTYSIINTTEDLIASKGETKASFLTTNEPRNFTYSEITAESVDTTSNTSKETINECVASSSSYSFSCTFRGRFADMRNLSCSSYFLCSSLRNGTLIKTSYKCPTNSWFDPAAERCSTSYVCPCTDTSTISGANTTISVSTIGDSTTTPEGATSSFPKPDRDTYSIINSTQHDMISSTRETQASFSTTNEPRNYTYSTRTANSEDSTSSASTTTLNECIASSSSNAFSCTSSGRFADMRDLFCSSYFLCSALRNGTLIKTSYKCPTNSWFDPIAERCSTLYVCPCSDTSTKTGGSTTIGDSTTTPVGETSTFPITDRGTYSIINSTEYMTALTEKTQASVLTTNQPRNYTYSENTANSVDTTSNTSTETANKCIASFSSYSFNCTSRGRFADMRDLSCSSYFLCSALRNGTLLKTSYKCPTNSWFDPSAERCSTLYVCLCSDTSTVSEASTTISISTISDTTKTPEGATSSFPITDRDTYSIINSTEDMTASTGETQAIVLTTNEPRNFTYSENASNSVDTTSDTSTETVNECVASSSSYLFNCTSRGRFTDMRDLSCSSYFLCSALRNGTLIKTYYKCPTNSLFDRSAQRCSTLYVCPCSDMSTRSGVSTTISVSTIGETTTTPVGETSAFPITDRDTYSMINTTEDMIASKGQTKASFLTTNEPRNFTYSENTAKSVDTTSNTFTETVNKCVASSSSYSFNCTSRGRFADVRDLSCSSYFLCSALRNGTLIKTSYKCPTNSWFDTSAERCSTLYVCPCTDTSTISVANTTISASTMGDSTTTPEGVTSSFSITNRDTYSITNSTQDMIASTGETQAGFSTTNEPRNHTYSTKTANSEDSTSSASTTTINECIASSSSNAFSCTSRGRFANMRDFSCSSYFLCSALRNGTLIKTFYKCPTNSWFDPTAKRCSTLHVCPCSDTSMMSGTSTMISVITIGDSTTTPVGEISSFPVTDTGTYSMINSTEYMIALTEKTRASVLTTNQPRNYTYSANSVDTTSNTSTETANECIASSSYYSFNCTSRGRFADMRDLSCSSYFLCSALRNGTLLKTSYKCPTNSWFDPSAERCSTSYVCSCSDTSTVSEASTTISVLTIIETTTTPVGETSSSPITDRDTYSIINTTEDLIASKGETKASFLTTNEPRNFTYSEITAESVDTTSNTSKETINECVASSSSYSFNCTFRGRFADMRNLSCSSYFLCSALRNGTLIKTSYKCPTNSWFDPAAERCSTSYVCPCTDTSTISGANTTISVSTIGDSTTTPEGATSSFPKPDRDTYSIINSTQHDMISSTRETQASFSTTNEPSNYTYSTRTANSEDSTSSASTTTLNECIASSSSYAFSCTSSGRFADMRDLFCSSYFLCSALRNGTLIKTSYKCPTNSWFDPIAEKCSTLYVCPCSDTSTKTGGSTTIGDSTTTPVGETSTFPITDRGTYSIINSTEYMIALTEKTQASVLTTNQPRNYTYFENTANSVDTTSNTSTETANKCIASFSSYSFNCTSRGRFADMRDLSCSSYFLCSALRNGTLLKTSYKCPTNSWFDPSAERCSTLYVCLCSDTSTVKEASTTISISTISDTTKTPEGATSSFPITDRDTYSIINSTEDMTASTGETQAIVLTTNEPRNFTYSEDAANSVDTTSDTSTETLNECVASSSSYLFNCTSRGRFTDMRDLSCSSYFLCSAVRNGTLIKTYYKCPTNSLFDRSAQRCSTLYVCPCSDMSTRSGVSTTISVSTIGETTTTPVGETSAFAITDRDTYSMINTTEDMIASKGQTKASFLTTNEPRNFTYSENTAKSVDTTSNTFTETVNKCVASSSSYSFNCTSRGRFADVRDLSCSSYFLCSALRNGTLIKTSYKCPTNSWFDTSAERCSILYVCPCTDTSTISVANTTISASTIGDSTTTPEGATSSFSITNRDTYSITNSTQDMIASTGETQAGFSTTNEPRNHIYSTKTANSEDSTSSASTTTINECIASSSSNAFSCTSRGRFANMRDLSCSSYFLCSALRNGTLIKTFYKCPTNSWFDPTAERCSTLYVCPCSDTSMISGASTMISVITIGDSTTTPVGEISSFPVTDTGTYSMINSTEYMIALTEKTRASVLTTNQPRNYTYSANSVDTTSNTSTETANECIASSSYYSFNCTSRGRFADMRDLSCSSYFLCSALRNGTLLKTSYKCPTNSWFDPSAERCSTSYVCSCSDTSTVSEASTTISVLTIGETTTTPVGETSSSPITDRDTYSIINTTEDLIASKGETKASFLTTNEPRNFTYSEITAESVDTTSNTSKETINECVASSSSYSFNCTFRGRFADMRNLSCSSYFLCSALRNGTLIKTSYKCPTNSWFDPAAERCSTSYVCPCTDTSTISGANTTISVSTIGDSTTTPEGATSSFPKPDRDTYSIINSTQHDMISSTRETQASFSTTNEPRNYTYSTRTANSEDSTSSASTTTLNECIASSSSNAFSCTSSGRFADMRDLFCSSYFLCSALRNGTLIKTSYKCPTNSWFDPIAERCSTLYVCPCSDTSTKTGGSTTIGDSTTTPVGETSSFLITDRGTYSIINSTEYMIALTEKTQASVSTTNQPRNYTYSENTTNSVDTTSNTSTETANKCIASFSPYSFNCTSRGRFADMRDLSCSSYFLCSALRNGTLLKTSYKCPTNSWFDPSAERCSTLYVCSCSDTSTVSEASTPISISTISDTTKTPEGATTSFPITDRDTFSIINSTEDMTASTGETQAILLTTNEPRNFTYSENAANSVDTTSNSSTETVNECVASSSSYLFNCTSRGRFTDMRDLSCSSYFLCSALRNGTLIKTSYKCPTSSWFDPTSQRCSTMYICPCSETISGATTT